MKIGIISIFPDMFDAIVKFGMTRLAIEAGAIELNLFNPRDYCQDRHRMVDDRPYGGGPGMLMKPEPLANCIDDVQAKITALAKIPAPVIYLTPQGEKVNHSLIAELAESPAMILLAGRYEGVDERIIDSRVDRELSIGDYVVSGGELPAMILIDAVTRLLPKVVGNELSVEQDSFIDNLLDHPHYTRPAVFEGQQVPDVLLSGDHEKIRVWRADQAKARTQKRRPDLLQLKRNNGVGL